jgi:RES domain
MKCCAECFGDRGLRAFISDISNEVGVCSFCQTAGVPLVVPNELSENFGTLMGIYRQVDAGGQSIMDWLKQDWLLMEHPNLDTPRKQSLLGDIMNDGDVGRRLYVPVQPDHRELIDPWNALIDEVTHNNRFFPKVDFDEGRLYDLLAIVTFDFAGSPERWHRARIEKEARRYEPGEMGPPPREIATHGRANPAGIPYLYLGSTPGTAVAEVRPHPGEKVCVAEFEVPTDIKIVDLTEPRRLISPFLMTDEDILSSLRGGDISFLEHLGDRLTTPILPAAAAIEYTASQYLCEFIKKCGHKGVAYSSSVSKGINLALFDQAVAKVGAVTEYRVDNVAVEITAI